MDSKRHRLKTAELKKVQLCFEKVGKSVAMKLQFDYVLIFVENRPQHFTHFNVRSSQLT